MKLLFDENLSRRLPVRLADLYAGSVHVCEADLLQSEDAEIWKYAGAHGFTIVSTDSDFFEMATASGPPPKIIWLRRWGHPTKDAEALLRREAIRVAGFAADAELGVLVLDLE